MLDAPCWRTDGDTDYALPYLALPPLSSRSFSPSPPHVILLSQDYMTVGEWRGHVHYETLGEIL
jgi:hypothetical protein